MPNPAANKHPKATSMASYARPSLPFASPETLKTLKTPKRLKTLQTLQKLLRTPNHAGKSYPKASGRSSHSNFAKASRNAQPRMQKLPQGHIHRFFWAVQPAVRLKRFKLLKLYKLAWHAKPRRQNLNLKARSLASSSRPSLPFASLYTLQKVPQGQINGFFAAFKAAVYQPSPSQRRPWQKTGSHRPFDGLLALSSRHWPHSLCKRGKCKHTLSPSQRRPWQKTGSHRPFDGLLALSSRHWPHSLCKRGKCKHTLSPSQRRPSQKTGFHHRRVCGNQFSVKDGVVKEKAYVYICPACKGNVASDVRTGQIDHRRVCGNQFSVKDGVVTEKAYVYVCPACKGNVASDVKTGQIDRPFDGLFALSSRHWPHSLCKRGKYKHTLSPSQRRPSQKTGFHRPFDGLFALSSRHWPHSLCKRGKRKHTLSPSQRRPSQKTGSHRPFDGLFALSSRHWPHSLCKRGKRKHTLSQRPARPTPGNGCHMRAGDLHGPCVYCSPQTFGKRDKHIGNSCLSSLLLLHLPATSPSPSRWHCSAVCSSFLPACLCFLPKPGSDREMHPQPHACCYLSLPARVSTFIWLTGVNKEMHDYRIWMTAWVSAWMQYYCWSPIPWLGW